MAELLSKQPQAAAGGHTVNALPDNPYATASQLLVGYLYDMPDADHPGPRFFTTNNLALSRALFEALGGFDPSFPHAAAEDRDLCERWVAQGHSLARCEAAVVQHRHEMGFREFWTQHLRYGRGARVLEAARLQRGAVGLATAPVNFYTGLVRLGFQSGGTVRGLQLGALLCLTQAATAFGYYRHRG
jgi:GT2 family glycosyltransferase